MIEKPKHWSQQGQYIVWYESMWKHKWLTTTQLAIISYIVGIMMMRNYKKWNMKNRKLADMFGVKVRYVEKIWNIMILIGILDVNRNLIMECPTSVLQDAMLHTESVLQDADENKKKRPTGRTKRPTGRIDDLFFIAETGSLMYSQSMYPNQSTLSSQSYNISQSVYTPLDQAPGQKTDMMIEFAKLFGNI